MYSALQLYAGIYLQTQVCCLGLSVREQYFTSARTGVNELENDGENVYVD